MTRHFRSPSAARVLPAALLLWLGAFSASAAPGFWQAATQADFLRGDVDQLSVDEHGRLMLGPEVAKIHDGGVPFVWTIVPGPDGALLLGTGNDGKVLKVDRSGQGSVFYDSSEMEVHALAAAPDGGLYVGTSPDGRIYKVDAKGQSSTFFDPEDKYIWSIVVDKKGVLYAGTGDKGVVYRVTPDGTGTPFFSTKATHAVALAIDPAGRLLVGTGSPGRIFRVDEAGKGFLALDTTYQEVRSLRLDGKGVLYAAAQSGRQSPGGEASIEFPSTPPPAPVPSVSTEITGFQIIDVPVPPQSPSTSSASGAARGGPTGAVFRVLTDGLWDVVWESREDAPYDLAIEPDGALLVATGGKGKLFRLAGDPVRSVLLTRVPAQQATMIHRVADRTLIATSNPGAVVAVSQARASRGTYESEVKDARMVASWGTISWRSAAPGSTRVEVYTRSGNTRTPDEAWSDWAGPYETATGAAITSPKARYLQWRAVLTGKSESPILTSVSASYLQRNVRPQVESITVHPPGVVFQKPFSTGEAEIAGFDEEPQDRRLANQGSSQSMGQSLGRRAYQKGLQTFAWKAEDENRDELTYDVLYRREGDTVWRPLKSGLVDQLLVWDTSSTPNGTYTLKVVASDARQNPSETALRGELESESFEIDNTAPSVNVGTARRDGTRFVVPIEVRDADSALTRVEYSLDAQKWQSAFPRDGILDGRQETFELRLEADSAGRTLVVRAADSLNNVGSGQAVVR
jgi:hypothetical protein